jgi:hypothetical protein
MLIFSVSILGLGGAMWRQKRLICPISLFFENIYSKENPGVVLCTISLLLVDNPARCYVISKYLFM